MTALRPLWASLAALLLLGAPAMAQVNGTSADSQDKQLTLSTQERGCDDGRTFCFDIEEQPSELEPGDEVNLTLRNDANTTHSAYVARNESADPHHQDTPAAVAFANTTTIGPGETASTTFTVPEDAEALYIWCDVTGHESAGMWLTIEVASGNATSEDEESSFGNETGGNGTDGDRTNGSDEDSSFGNGTAGNATDGDGTDGNATSGNDTNTPSEDEASGNDTDDDASGGPFGEEGGTDEPLQEASEDGGQDGQQSTPIGWTLAIGAVVAAMVLTAVVGRR